MVERAAHDSATLTVELVLRRPLERRAGRHRTLDHRVGVLDVQVDRERRGGAGLRSEDAVLREFVRQHQGHRAELELRMADAAAGFREAEFLSRAERPHVELDGLPGVLDAEIGEQLVNFHARAPGARVNDPATLDRRARTSVAGGQFAEGTDTPVRR
jgi:hypothetical protein